MKAFGKRVLRPVTSVLDARIRGVARKALAPAAAKAEEETRAAVGALSGEVAKLRADLDRVQRELAEVRGENLGLELLLDPAGRGKARRPSRSEWAKLVTEIQVVTGDEFARRSATTAYRTLVALEAIGVGRMAGGTANVVGKLATAPLLAPPRNNDVLEIGTLHGLFAAGLLRQLHRRGLEPNLTIVDPLAGDQLQPGRMTTRDVSGVPIRPDVVRANLALAGPAGERTRLRQGFSGDAVVRAEVGDRAYGVLIIDGDHSFEGVLADLEWAEQIAADGALVVMDDYGDRYWPGVTEALDKHLGGTTRMRLLGKVSTSAYLRVG
ncbi:class I SAM-dependent methyltransferase [Phytomonospora endophytica]|uniref:Class I SAM-dependent methyltransferase n=1 Tax=Phytomonospora endophytica TaxID=714109 RepID=A0A841G2X7_9ACTN|nr:class I SAM-dependent methyltransferase [Phytomonospora endophytica]MBB6038480.1 hypothetical protein [Phytomonospora endophytica]GIG64409.1 hypothetical protein Pen01_07040 [Phytomonospora endophytica]